MGHIGRNFKLLLALVVSLGLLALGFPTRSTWADSLRDEMIAKAKKEGEFVVAGSNADTFRDELKGFGKKYPFITMKAFTANTGDTINRISAEAKSGKLSIDTVATSSDGLELLAKANLVEKMEFPHLKDIPAETQPKHGRFFSYS